MSNVTYQVATYFSDGETPASIQRYSRVSIAIDLARVLVGNPKVAQFSILETDDFDGQTLLFVRHVDGVAEATGVLAKTVL